MFFQRGTNPARQSPGSFMAGIKKLDVVVHAKIITTTSEQANWDSKEKVHSENVI